MAGGYPLGQWKARDSDEGRGLVYLHKSMEGAGGGDGKLCFQSDA